MPRILAAGCTLIVSLVCRNIDMAVCPAFPLGAHFLWHILNAVVLYLLLRAALVDGARKEEDNSLSISA